MRGKDLTPGLVVCLPSGNYYSPAYDHLGNANNVRAIVLDDRRVWRNSRDPEDGGWHPRPVGDETNTWRPKKAGYALAIESPEYVEVGEEWEPTGEVTWTPKVVEARAIMGTWAEHLTVKVALEAKHAKQAERERAEEIQTDAWATEVESAMAWLGIDWRPTPKLSPVKYAGVDVTIPAAVLDQIVAKVGDLETGRLSEVRR